jgi:hypothetical protein
MNRDHLVFASERDLSAILGESSGEDAAPGRRHDLDGRAALRLIVGAQGRMNGKKCEGRQCDPTALVPPGRQKA